VGPMARLFNHKVSFALHPFLDGPPDDGRGWGLMLLDTGVPPGENRQGKGGALGFPRGSCVMCDPYLYVAGCQG
jgi:hypothetical protein